PRAAEQSVPLKRGKGLEAASHSDGECSRYWHQRRWHNSSFRILPNGATRLLGRLPVLFCARVGGRPAPTTTVCCGIQRRCASARLACPSFAAETAKPPSRHFRSPGAPRRVGRAYAALRPIFKGSSETECTMANYSTM